MADTVVTVAQFPKNARHVCRITLREYRRHHLFDLRIFWPDQATESYLPMRQGIALDVKLFPAFKRAVLMLEQVLKDEYALTDEDLNAADITTFSEEG